VAPPAVRPAPVAVPVSAADAPALAPPATPADPREPAFVDAATIRAAAIAAGLRLPSGVYANVAAALGAGKHLLLTGAPGSGKTALALAVARAAAQAGKARGATVVTGDPRELVPEAAAQGRWVIVDELDQADLQATYGPLSSLLAGVPVTFAHGEATPAEHWRLIATWNGEAPPRAAILRRFAVIEVHGPTGDELHAAIKHAASGDATATAAAEKLTHYADRVGVGVLLDAARHAAARQAAVPTDPDTLAQELLAAYIAPLIEP
jgi:MoxR-like ATPase